MTCPARTAGVRHEALVVRMEVRDRPSPRRRSGGVLATVPAKSLMLVRVDSEELERSDEVTSGLAECCGDVGFPGQAQGADGEVSEAGHDAGSVVSACLGGVFAVGDVADVVELVLDAPMFARVGGDLRGVRVASRLVMPRTAMALFFPVLVSVT